MKQNSHIGCLCHDYIAVDGNGDVLKDNSKTSYSQKLLPEKIDFTDARCHIRGLGCLTAITRDLRDFIFSAIPIADLVKMPTDFTICRMAMLRDELYTINYPLIYHRFHANNASNKISIATGLQGTNSLTTRIEVLTNAKIIAEHYVKITKESKAKYLLFVNRRIAFLKNGDLYALLQAYLAYHKNYSLILLLGDIAYYYGLNKLAGKIYRLLKR